MRRRTSLNSYVPLVFALIICFNLPFSFVASLREKCNAIVSPIWVLSQKISSTVSDPVQQISNLKELQASAELLEQTAIELTLENTLLKEELLKLSPIQPASFDNLAVSLLPEHFKLKKGELKLQHTEAKVLYRNPASWSSSFWVNVGEESNSLDDACHIGLNSPVIKGTALVGVIDYVGKNQSRVRLITDSGMTTSVRAVRGGAQQHLFYQAAQNLLQLKNLSFFKNFPQAFQDQLVEQLNELKQKAALNAESSYWAKGELRGKSLPLWRANNQLLEGSGFNYDFSDEFQEQTELLSMTADNQWKIIQNGDLLITSGLDGFFPPGLAVAQVSKVEPLNTGAYYFDIEAKPVMGNIQEITTVTILPPSHFETIEVTPY